MVAEIEDEAGFLNHYLDGHCGQLAIALSMHLGAPVKALFAMNVDTDGRRHVGNDFIHAYVLGEGALALDARGFRSEEAIRAEFSPVLAGQRLNRDTAITYHEQVFASAELFIAEAGADPSGAVEALLHARTYLGLSADITLTLFALEQLAECRHNGAPVLNIKAPALSTPDDGLPIS